MASPRKVPAPRVSRPKAKPVSRGSIRSAAVNKGQMGTMKRAAPKGDGRREGASSPMAMARKMPASRTSSAEGARNPMSRKLPSIKRPAQVSVNPGGLAGLAKGVSDNFGRGVSEARKQLGSVKIGGPSAPSPLSSKSLGRAVNENKGKSWINK